MDALQTCYSKITTNFGAGGDKYDIQGHRGTDYSVQDGWVYAYDDMVIESIDHGSGLGWSVGLKRLTLGGFCGFAHIKNLQGSKGMVIPKGGKIAQVASWNDDHGSLWTGPHKHTTQGEISAYNCSVGIRPLSDPAPVIAAAVGSSTAGGGTTPIIEGEEDMTYGLKVVQAGPELPGVPVGSVFIGAGTDPLVWVSNYGPEQINGVKFAEWTAKAIAERITQVGLRGSGNDINKVYKSMADARAVKPVYVL